MNALDILKRCRDGFDEVKEIESAIQRREKMGIGTEELPDLQHRLQMRKRRHRAERTATLYICESLKAAERDVMFARYAERKSVAQISIFLKISESSVKRTIRIAEQNLELLGMSDMTGYLPEWYEKQERSEPGEPG